MVYRGTRHKRLSFSFLTEILLRPKKGRQASTYRLAGRASRFSVFRWGLGAAAIVLIVRLCYLQVFQHGLYEALAPGQHEIFARLSPERGDILLKDRFEEKYYPVATNQELTLIYSDNRRLTDPSAAAAALAPVIGRDAAEIEKLLG